MDQSDAWVVGLLHLCSGVKNQPPTSRRRDAQQLCLIFQTTAATRSSDRKQLWREQAKGQKVTPRATVKVHPSWSRSSTTPGGGAMSRSWVEALNSAEPRPQSSAPFGWMSAIRGTLCRRGAASDVTLTQPLVLRVLKIKLGTVTLCIYARQTVQKQQKS